jgi:hypothetical protein
VEALGIDAGEATQGAAYGVRFVGLDPSPTLALHGADDWYPVEVALTTPRVVKMRISFDELGVTAGYESVQVHVDRPRRRVEISSVEALDRGSLAHPYLALPAALFAHWAGREAVHAAGVVLGGRAWGLVGKSEQGKSTLAAALLAAGHEVLVDDVLVVDGATAFAGPRCVDLRDGVRARLGLREPTERARADTRDRVILTPTRGQAPLGGFVHLEWGDDVGITPLAVDERLRRLMVARSLPSCRAHGEVMLDLAVLPAWELIRPQRWNTFEVATRLLLDTLATAAPA